MEQSDELVRFLRKNLSRRGLEDFLRRSVCTRPECMTLTSRVVWTGTAQCGLWMTPLINGDVVC